MGDFQNHVSVVYIDALRDVGKDLHNPSSPFSLLFISALTAAEFSSSSIIIPTQASFSFSTSEM